MDNRKKVENEGVEKIARRKSIKLYLMGILVIICTTVGVSLIVYIVEGTIINAVTIVGLIALSLYMIMCPIIRPSLEKDYLKEGKMKIN